MNVSLAECNHRSDEYLSDATDFKFIVNAEHDGGVIYRLKQIDQGDTALELIRQAYELAAE